MRYVYMCKNEVAGDVCIVAFRLVDPEKGLHIADAAGSHRNAHLLRA